MDAVVNKEARNILLITAMFFIFVGLFTLTSFLSFYTFSYTDIDLAIATQVFHNTINGRIMHNSWGDFVIFGGGHMPLIFFLLSPIYALFPGPCVLLFLQALFLGSGVFAVYLIAKKILNPGFALYFSFAYLVYPALHYVMLYEVHEIAFCVPLLLFMFYFFLKRQFWQFLLFMFLSLFCREDVALVIIGFSVFVFLSSVAKKEKVSAKWIISPLLSGIIWFILAIYLAVYTQRTSPGLKGLEGYGKINSTFLGHYFWLGTSPREIFINLFTRPFYIIGNIFTFDKAKYIFQLFIPLAFLPAFGFYSLVIVLFGLSEIFLSRLFLASIYLHYSSMLIPFIFIAAIFGLNNILSINFLKSKKKIILISLFSVSILSAIRIGPLAAFPRAISSMFWMKNTPEVVLKSFFVNKIPKDKPAITTCEFMSHLTGRKALYSFHIFTNDAYKSYIPLMKEKSVYGLVNFDDPLTFHSLLYREKDGLQSRCFLLQDGWGLVESIEPFAIFKKGLASDYKIIESKGLLASQDRKRVNPGSDIEVLGYSYTTGMVEGFPVLDLDLIVLKSKASNNNYIPMVTIVANDGKSMNRPLIAPFRIYPFREWKENEMVRIRSKVLLPEEVMGNLKSVGVFFAKGENF